MNDLSVKDLSKEIRDAIAALKDSPDVQKVGVVTRVGDGIAWIYGLSNAGYSEMLEIDGVDGNKVPAFALNLMEDEIGAVLMGEDVNVRAGAKVRLTGKVLEVPVGPELVGRVVDPLGRPLDGKAPIKTKHTGQIEKPAPGVLDRKSVHEPLMTGLMAIDAMVPIGRGQRELIIGDRQTGKTAVAVDTMINQHRQGTGVINIYVAVGQKLNKVAHIVERVKRGCVNEQTNVDVTSSSTTASLHYPATYAGTAIEEYIHDRGQHAQYI